MKKSDLKTKTKMTILMQFLSLISWADREIQELKIVNLNQRFQLKSSLGIKYNMTRKTGKKVPLI